MQDKYNTFQNIGQALQEKMISEGKYTEIVRLHIMLKKAGIPHEMKAEAGGYHIIYPESGKGVCSVIEHNFSYGRDENLLEISGLLTEEEAENDSVLGYLNAVEVFNRIADDWEEREQCHFEKEPDLGEER